jgi:hypothetical protein
MAVWVAIASFQPLHLLVVEQREQIILVVVLVVLVVAVERLVVLVAQEILQPHHLKAVMAHLPHQVKAIMAETERPQAHLVLVVAVVLERLAVLEQQRHRVMVVLEPLQQFLDHP